MSYTFFKLKENPTNGMVYIVLKDIIYFHVYELQNLVIHLPFEYQNIEAQYLNHDAIFQPQT
jgi:hypothetical protein